MKVKKIKKAKAKHMAIMFFVVGAWGIGVSVMFGNASNPLILVLSAVNLALGGVFTVFYTRAKK